MPAVPPHPYRTALEARDGEALAAALRPDVVFFPAGFEQPIRGRANVLAFFMVLVTIFEDPVIVDELVGEGTRAIAFELQVDGQPLEGVDHLVLDDEGLVSEITVTMRPLAPLQILTDRLRDTA